MAILAHEVMTEIQNHIQFYGTFHDSSSEEEFLTLCSDYFQRGSYSTGVVDVCIGTTANALGVNLNSGWWWSLMCLCSSSSLYLETEHLFRLQANLCTSLKWLSLSACFTKCYSHSGRTTFLCLLFMCMLHLATLEKCLSQCLHFTWQSWQLVSMVTGPRDTCGLA